MTRETDLYPPIKAHFEALGFDVKSEICGADVVALRGTDPPVIIEMKRRMSLKLVHQGIARLAVSDYVYLAVERQPGAGFRRALRENVKLARRLGLGLISVRLANGRVEMHCDPGPYAPRKSARHQAQLMREFSRRAGDPNLGGTRGQILTAYRQDALACAGYLAAAGPHKGAAVRDATGVAKATRLMRDDHYGWFQRVSTGIYGVTEAGLAALDQWGGNEKLGPTPSAGHAGPAAAPETPQTCE